MCTPLEKLSVEGSDSFVAGKAKRKDCVRVFRSVGGGVRFHRGKDQIVTQNRNTRAVRCAQCVRRRAIYWRKNEERTRTQRIYRLDDYSSDFGAAVARSRDETNEQIARTSRKKGRRKLSRRNEIISPAKTYRRSVHDSNENEQRILTASTLQLPDDISREIETIHDRPPVWNILRVPSLRCYD